MPGSSASRSAIASVSAGIAAANAHLPKPAEPGPRFPGEDGGRSLAEMAYRDLDAALQLLAERALYITGASGAAIALRRGQHNDMLCRATTGSNAPELGALLSMEYGLSGESVRTRQVLRCDDAERDLRVNREACRNLGIASVVVMPIVSEEQVLGVFELLSGEPRAFDERSLSALQRLSEMVETAVKHAAAAQVVPAAPAVGAVEVQPPVDVAAPETAPVASPSSVIVAERTDAIPAAAPTPSVKELPPQELGKTEPEKTEPEKAELAKTEPEETKPQPLPKKPLFWSAAVHTQPAAVRPEAVSESIAVPPVLRNLQKCQACGFPVSQGRTFCVECEEKQWRGQYLPQPAAGQQPDPPPPPQMDATVREAQGIFVQDYPSAQVSGLTTEPVGTLVAGAAPDSAVGKLDLTSQPIEPATAEAPIATTSTPPASEVLVEVPATDNSTPFLSSALPSESWFAANKYILGALLVVAIIIAAVAWLR